MFGARVSVDKCLGESCLSVAGLMLRGVGRRLNGFMQAQNGHDVDVRAVTMRSFCADVGASHRGVLYFTVNLFVRFAVTFLMKQRTPCYAWGPLTDRVSEGGNAIGRVRPSVFLHSLNVDFCMRIGHGHSSQGI